MFTRIINFVKQEAKQPYVWMMVVFASMNAYKGYEENGLAVSILLFFAWWAGLVVGTMILCQGILTVLNFVIYRSPIFIQRPFYKMWKAKISRIETSPLLAYPLQIFIAFNLDEEFNKGGLRQAEIALQKYFNEMSEKMEKGLNEIVEANIRRNKAIEARKVEEAEMAELRKTSDKNPSPEELQLLKEGKYIEALRDYRKRTGMPFKESKAAIDAHDTKYLKGS